MPPSTMAAAPLARYQYRPLSLPPAEHLEGLECVEGAREHQADAHVARERRAVQRVRGMRTDVHMCVLVSHFHSGHRCRSIHPS